MGSFCFDRTTAYWIGLVKDFPSPGSTAHWLDGENATYRNWADGEPNGNVTCVRLSNNGKWKDHDCSLAHAYACKTVGLLNDAGKSNVVLIRLLISKDTY